MRRKRPVPESLFNKGSGLQLGALSKEAVIRVFLVNFSKFIGTGFFSEHKRNTASVRQL